jgi:hypothetical protein
VNAFEHLITATRAGLYESNYLKANAPDGSAALWIKHNTLRPATGEGKGEFWLVWWEQGRPPIVAKREVPWSALSVDADRLRIAAGSISLTPERATGALADLSWDLRLSGGLPPLFHLPYAWMYTAGFPKKKALTPSPNLRFDGVVHVGGRKVDVTGWVGLRGHNWGTEHAPTYAYGSCNTWDDGATDRTVDGFSVRIRLGGRLTPWLTSVVSRRPDLDRTALRCWFGAGTVTPTTWTARWSAPHLRRAELMMTADPASYAGLRYVHPDGRESYCYNTKFARVTLRVGGQVHTSRQGELEVLFPEPLPEIALHPTPGWDFAAGDYRSA